MPEELSRRVSRFSRSFLSGAILIALAMTACTDAGRNATPLQVGYMICNSLEETRERFEPLTVYLGEQLGREVRSVYMDTVDFEEALQSETFDIIHTNSLLYIWFKEQFDFDILSGERRGEHGSFSAGAVIVREDSDIHSLSELRGKRFVFGPQLAPTAFLSQYSVMLDEGIDPETDLGYYAIPWGSFKHEKAVYGVWFGKYDAGAAPLLDLELMERDRKVPLDDLRVIAQGPLIPYCVFSSAPHLPRKTFEKVQKVLFTLNEEATAAVGGEAVKVLKSAGVDGFEALQDSDFDTLRSMARQSGLPPFAEY